LPGSYSARAARGCAILNVLELESRDVPTFLGNQLFPLDNPWNQDVSAAPVAGNSAAIISRIISRHSGTAPALHADFGNPATDGALYGIPINIATSSTPKYTIYIPTQGYADESDIVQVPIPNGAVIEGDGPTGPAPVGSRGDSHLLVYDRDANVLYELVSAARPGETQLPYGGTKPSASWGAWQISRWDLNTNDFRTIGDTSADAAGLPILTGLVRPDEALPTSAGGAGVINHAIRMTVQQVTDSFVYPASHLTTGYHATDLPRMGERFRLKSSFVIPSTWSPEAKAIAQAMKTYGLIVADNGSDMFFQGHPSTSWNMDSVLQVQSIRASDFEVVDLTPKITGLSISTGSTAGGASVTITGQNFSGAAGRLHVYFGTTEATSFTIQSDTKIVVNAPAHAAGTVDVRVQSGENETDNNNQTVFFGYGSSANTAADDFTFGGTSPPPPPPPPPPPAAVGQPFAVGTNGGTVAKVTMYSADRTVRFTATPFGSSFTDSLQVAVGDVTGDGVADVVVASFGNGATLVRTAVINGATGAIVSTPALVPAGYVRAPSVAVGDVTGDGVADIALGINEALPRVRVYRGGDFAKIADFVPMTTANFRGRVSVAVGDVNHDGTADVVVSGWYPDGTRMTAFTGTSLRPGVTPKAIFATQVMGMFVTGANLAAGDLNGDGYADIVVGTFAGVTPAVKVFSGKTLTLSQTRSELAFFTPAKGAPATGVRVAVRDVNGDGKLDLLTSSGEQVSAYEGKSLAPTGLPPLLFAFDPDPLVNGGVWVG
jgi:hypothetical protein